MWKPYRLERKWKKQQRKLHEKAQKLHVLDKLPEVVQGVASYGGRRRRLNSIAHTQGGT